MKDIPDELKALTVNGLSKQNTPSAMLKVDIDPPFVGEDFRPDCCDPDLAEFGGVLYLSLVEAGKIKIFIVDPKTRKVVGTLREIAAEGARHPRLAFEPSTYPGKPDLPHVAYEMPDGHVWVYRETYDAQGNVVPRYDDIGIGTSPDCLRLKGVVWDYFTRPDGVYQRKQGTFEERIIAAGSGEIIKGVRAFLFPDSRVGFLHIAQTATGDEVRLWTSELLDGMYIDDGMQFGSSVFSLELPLMNHSFSDGMNLGSSVLMLELVDMMRSITDNMQFSSIVQAFNLVEPINIDVDYMGFMASVQAAVLQIPANLSDDMQMTSSVIGLELS
jgi:hypothetical protein